VLATAIKRYTKEKWEHWSIRLLSNSRSYAVFRYRYKKNVRSDIWNQNKTKMKNKICDIFGFIFQLSVIKNWSKYPCARAILTRAKIGEVDHGSAHWSLNGTIDGQQAASCRKEDYDIRRFKWHPAWRFLRKTPIID
jgi:hypothetical protein